MKATLSIPGLIDQEAMSALQWRVLVLCFLIALFDGFDTQAMAFTGPAILDAFKLQSRDLAPILTAGIVGMVFGAMMLGVAVFGAAQSSPAYCWACPQARCWPF